MIIRPTLPETPNYTTPRGTIKKLMRLTPQLPIEWAQQRKLLGFH